MNHAPIEQHVHDYLVMVPVMAVSFISVLVWCGRCAAAEKRRHLPGRLLRGSPFELAAIRIDVALQDHATAWPPQP